MQTVELHCKENTSTYIVLLLIIDKGTCALISIPIVEIHNLTKFGRSKILQDSSSRHTGTYLEESKTHQEMPWEEIYDSKTSQDSSRHTVGILN